MLDYCYVYTLRERKGGEEKEHEREKEVDTGLTTDRESSKEQHDRKEIPKTLDQLRVGTAIFNYFFFLISLL